jgi:hypothetical protein
VANASLEPLGIKGGHRRLGTTRFPLARSTRCIVRALERHYDCTHSIRATVAPRLGRLVLLSLNVELNRDEYWAQDT